MANVDEDQFFNKYKPNVSEDEFFNKYSQSGQEGLSRLPFDEGSPTLIDPTQTIKDTHQDFINKGPFTGSVSDRLFQQGSVGRIASSFGHDFKGGWDSIPSLYESELDKESKDKDAGLLTGVRNAYMKPVTAALDFLIKSGFGVASGIPGAIGQAGVELQDKARALEEDEAQPDWSINTPWEKINLAPGHLLAAPLGAASELLRGAASGAGLEGGLHGPVQGIDHMQQILEARSKGMIGEGEAGYFKVTPPTPDDLQRRAAAAQEAGLPQQFPEGATSSIEDHVPTVHELARQIDPDTYNKLDNLQDNKEILQASKQAYTTEYKQAEENGISENHPEQLHRVQKIAELQDRIQKADEGLRDLIPDTADARQRAQELLESQSPEGDAYRNLIQAQALEKAIAAEPLKQKAEETLRLANDMKDANQTPKTEEAKPAKKSLKSQVITGEAANDNTTTPNGTPTASSVRDKTPEVELSPETLNGRGLRKVQGTGEKTPLSMTQRLRLDSVMEGWRSDIGEVPEEEILKNEQQFGDALAFADKNPSLAERIAMGDAEVPEDVNIHPEAVLRVLKKQAVETGDVRLGLKLAETRLAGEARTMGQRLQLLRSGYDIDPVGIIQDINDMFKEKGVKTILKSVKDIKVALDDAMTSFKPDMEAFLKSFECDY